MAKKCEFQTIGDLLDAMKERGNYASDTALADGLGVNQTTLSAWRTGRGVPRETHALVIAEALEISPVLVLAIAAAERSATEKARKDWRLVVEHLARTALPTVAALAVMTGTYTPPVQAEGSVTVYSGKSRRRQIQGAAAQLAQ